ncbi:MAG: hypothetical protein P8L23_04890 [Flavobacteriales bacterium]|nr:hypothetical protein [Flavobacteriales bacterium]
MNTLSITTYPKQELPKLGVLTQLVELSRHDYIYIKEKLKPGIELEIAKDNSRIWDSQALAVFYKGFKLGYLSQSINRTVNRMIFNFGDVKIKVKSVHKTDLFKGLDVLIELR